MVCKNIFLFFPNYALPSPTESDQSNQSDQSNKSSKFNKFTIPTLHLSYTYITPTLYLSLHLHYTYPTLQVVYTIP